MSYMVRGVSFIYNVMRKLVFLLCLWICCYSLCVGKETGTTLFNAGEKGINSYRIPSIVTTKDGSLLVFCEARKVSWQDKSPTDIVMKRSQDNGKTWSEIQTLTQTQSGAFMDPTPVVDYISGKIMLFTSYWPDDNHTGEKNIVFVITSTDNGKTWSKAKEVGNLFPIGRNKKIIGFGPGSGLQIKGEKFKNRMILPLRVLDVKEGQKYDVAAYSDNQGKTWKVGTAMAVDNELQIAESPLGVLVYNSRIPNGRMVGRSTDGGVTWRDSKKDPYLPGVSKGCQGSVLGNDSVLFYSGIKGTEASDEFDERAKLTLYKSIDSGLNWREHNLIHEKASGYSCMTFLTDGRIAIVYEAASTDGFTRKSIPGSRPLKRPEGWMKIDFNVITDIPAPAYSTYYYQRTSLFEQLPVYSDDIVFIGNSITEEMNGLNNSIILM
jgi:sialidase-1